MNATRIVPGRPLMGTLAPSFVSAQLPTNAPAIPMMMSPTRPKPVPPMIIDASTPATRPTISHVRISICLTSRV